MDGSAGGAGYPGGQEKGCKARSLSAPVRIWICALLKDATCEMMMIHWSYLDYFRSFNILDIKRSNILFVLN